MTVVIRDATDDDLPTIRRVLYEAVSWDPDAELPPQDVVVEIPQLAIYHHGWGRSGDLGVIAEEDGEAIGGALSRVFTEEEHGEGFYDEQTPELGVAVWDGNRGRGVGTRLMDALEKRAAVEGFEKMSLSVEADNPATHLYERLGYRVIADRDGDLLMLKHLV